MACPWAGWREPVRALHNMHSACILMKSVQFVGFFHATLVFLVSSGFRISSFLPAGGSVWCVERSPLGGIPAANCRAPAIDQPVARARDAVRLRAGGDRGFSAD